MQANPLISDDFVDAIKLLSCFELDNLQQGIKLHQECDPTLRQAADRLHLKGILTAADGGYLTPFGMTLREQLQPLINALAEPSR